MKLIVADDAALMREGIVGLLERLGHQVVAQAASATELRAVCAQAFRAGDPPEVVITDVRMPPTMTDDGLRAAVDLRRDHPGLGIMVLSQYVAPAYATALFDDPATTGGVGYLLKDRVSRVADFARSLGIVQAGGVVVDPDVAAGLLGGRRARALAGLTPRELDVLGLMARGRSNSEIAAALFLSGAAVAKHVAGVFTKLASAPSRRTAGCGPCSPTWRPKTEHRVRSGRGSVAAVTESRPDPALTCRFSPFSAESRQFSVTRGP